MCFQRSVLFCGHNVRSRLHFKLCFWVSRFHERFSMSVLTSALIRKYNKVYCKKFVSLLIATVGRCLCSIRSDIVNFVLFLKAKLHLSLRLRLSSATFDATRSDNLRGGVKNPCIGSQNLWKLSIA